MQDSHSAWRPSKKIRPHFHFDPRQAALILSLVMLTVVADRGLIAFQSARQAAAPQASESRPQPRMTTVSAATWAAATEEGLAMIEVLERGGHERAIAQLQERGLVFRLDAEQQVTWIGSSGYMGARSQVRLKETGRELWTPSNIIR